MTDIQFLAVWFGAWALGYPTLMSLFTCQWRDFGYILLIDYLYIFICGVVLF
ncbi:hypothetical protein SELR_pSRC400760 (plasmid) [Selenomonas ruminantium subsp. lactilytica TAM6421]|uniref:Uncharacterized protein n=1 Tax=Selenomonas ruminantium subsp. lactilytica (strain NBRC 103574 / TAM6421) TaxID=927704 RepID=I0GVE0_SELRL|nr:hypothetical protein SELR_pSRC400760 [Selenomonas ruminantium subsp. lactilytica TAM6421]